MSTNFKGPLFTTGDTQQITSAAGVVLLPDPNQDRGPNGFFQGDGILDPRWQFTKDKVQGYTGVVPAELSQPQIIGINAVPAAHSTILIAAAANTVSGTAMTLASTFAAGRAINIPIVPFAGININTGAVTVAPIVLDYGFAFGNITSGSTTIVVSNSALFPVGTPLIIGGVGNSGGTAALPTIVLSITDATHIVVQDTPLATNATVPIGTGNIWGPSEQGFPAPTAHLPYWAGGPGLWLDPAQSLARGVVITANSASGAGGAFTVRGWDAFWQPMSETITSVPATSVTTYGKKAFKAILSVTPAFTDAGFTYAIGTSDVFGFPMRQDQGELATIWWAAGLMVTVPTGFVAGDTTMPATATTGDVRGTIQTSAFGPNTGIGSTASNGTITSLVMTGNKLVVTNGLSTFQQLTGRATTPQPYFGVTQFTN